MAVGTSGVPGAPALPSVAVLPFVDMSESKDQEYFADGISEELLNLLAKVPQLRVIARTSSFSFKGKEVDVATIAKEHAPAGLRWKLSPLLGTHPSLPALLFRRHLYTPGFKLTKIAGIITVLSVGLLPVLIGALAPKSLGMLERFMIWFGGVVTIFAALFFFLKAKVWKKA
mgnify:CR=1 FL=1